MAEAVFRHLVEREGLTDRIAVDSAGTGSWHVGEPPHPGTREVLRRHGIACDGRARQVTPEDLRTFDYVVAMDEENAATLRSMDRHGVLDGKLSLLLDFAPPGAPRSVPDPYYRGGFDRVFALVQAGCQGLLAHVRARHGW